MKMIRNVKVTDAKQIVSIYNYYIKNTIISEKTVQIIDYTFLNYLVNLFLAHCAKIVLFLLDLKLIKINHKNKLIC